MDNFSKVKFIIKSLKNKYPLKTALKYQNNFQLLVAVILSAQTTDDNVNKILPSLFSKYKSIKDFALANIDELQSLINSINFYKNKSKYIINSAKLIMEKYGGKVPLDMDSLLELPGVARKTANIVLGENNINSGIPVDTHVKRLAFRLGLTKNKDPKKIELDLMPLVPKKEWYNFSSILIWHGRKICKAKKPLCDKCVLNKICPKNGV